MAEDHDEHSEQTSAMLREVEGASAQSYAEGANLRSQVEAMIFASKDPLSASEISLILGERTYRKAVQKALDELVEAYRKRHERGEGGFFLREVAGGYQFQTVPECQDIMRRMFHLRPRPLSRAAQETLAIVAYREPVTRADIEYIRGLNAGSIIKNLLEKGLIQAVGRKEDSGRPLLFATTSKFLRMFGLTSLSDLPPLDSFQPSHEDVSLAEKYLGEAEDSPSMPAGDIMLSGAGVDQES